MSSVKQNTLYVSIGQAVRLVMALLLLPVASRVLGDESFGRYGVATTIMFFVMLVDDLGLNMWITREIAKNRTRSSMHLAHTIGSKLLLIFGSLVFLLVLLSLTSYDTETVRAVWIFSLYAIIISFRDAAVAVFRAFEDMIWETLVLSIERVLVTSLGVFALLSGGGLTGLSWAFVVSGIISLIISAVVLSSKFVRPSVSLDIRISAPMIRAAIAFGISMFLTTIYNRVDMMMLSVMKSPDVWGWYAAAHKLIDFTNVVPTVLMIATFPALARFSMSPGGLLDHLFTRGFKYLFLLTIPLVFSVIVLGDKMIGIVYGEEFMKAVPALKILGCTAAILFVNIFVSGLYGATNNQTRLVAYEVVGLVMNITINYLLIPSLAHVGAALATLFTEIVVLTLLLRFAFTKIVKLSEKKFFVDALAAASIMAVLVYLFRDYNVYFVFALCNSVYFLVLLGRKTVSFREILQLRSSEV